MCPGVYTQSRFRETVRFWFEKSTGIFRKIVSACGDWAVPFAGVGLDLKLISKKAVGLAFALAGQLLRTVTFRKITAASRLRRLHSRLSGTYRFIRRIATSHEK
jgi:hypothetical protein